jgi:predicted esterase
LGGIGTPEPTTFDSSLAAAADWLDAFLAQHGVGHDRLVIGGFSQVR